MSDDDITKQTPTEDKLDSLISLAHQLVSDMQNLQSQVNAKARANASDFLGK